MFNVMSGIVLQWYILIRIKKMRMLGVEKHIRQLAKRRYSNHGRSMANNRIQVIGPVTGLWENYRGFPATSVARSDPIDRSRQASVNGDCYLKSGNDFSTVFPHPQSMRQKNMSFMQVFLSPIFLRIATRPIPTHSNRSCCSNEFYQSLSLHIRFKRIFHSQTNNTVMWYNSLFKLDRAWGECMNYGEY